jgi:hypothetical protein
MAGAVVDIIAVVYNIKMPLYSEGQTVRSMQLAICDYGSVSSLFGLLVILVYVVFRLL